MLAIAQNATAKRVVTLVAVGMLQYCCRFCLLSSYERFVFIACPCMTVVIKPQAYPLREILSVRISPCCPIRL